VLTEFIWTGADSTAWNVAANWVDLETGNVATDYPRTTNDVAVFDPANRLGREVNTDADLGSDVTVGTVFLASRYTGTVSLRTAANRSADLTITKVYDQYGGTLGGPGTLVLGGTGSSAKGAIKGSSQLNGDPAGFSSVVVQAGSSLTIEGSPTFNNRVLEIAARSGRTAAGRVRVLGGARVNMVNARIFDRGNLETVNNVSFQANDGNGRASYIQIGSGGRFEATSTNPGNAGVSITAALDNYGTLSLNNTSVSLYGGGDSTGQYLGSGPNGSLYFLSPAAGPRASYSWRDGTSFSVGQRQPDGSFRGGVRLYNASANVSGTVSVGGGTLGLWSAFEISNSTISGPGNLEVDDGSVLTLSGGAVADNVTIDIAEPNGPLSGGSIVLHTGTLQNGASIINYNSAILTGIGPWAVNFTLNTGARILNGATATFDIQDDSSILGDGSGTFVNEGGATVKKSAGDGESQIRGVAFTNQGTLEVLAGTLKIPTDTQAAAAALQNATTVLNNGKLNTDGLLQLEGGVLENIGASAQDGEVYGDVLNTGGVVEPGGPGATGILTIDGTNGTYTQSGTGALDIDLANPTPGTGSDELVVTGAVDLGGTLNINTLPGFTGDSFTIIKNESPGPVVGLFDGLPEGATLTLAGRTFAITYEGGADGQDVVLNAVANLPTVTTVAGSANPSVYGQAVTFTATVAPAATGGAVPTGTVQFQVDGANFGAPVPLSAGTAISASLATLAPGMHTVTAVYSGDGRFLASTGTLTQAVIQAETAAAVVSSDPAAVYGEPLTFTAAVAPVSPGAGMPTGTIAFHAVLGNGTDVTLGTGTLDATGTAVFQMPSGMAVGTRGIYAVYLGDTNFSGSTSATITQVVNQAATTLQVTASASVIVAGQSVTFTDTLSAVLPGSFVTAPTGTITLYDTFDGVTTALSTLTLGGPPVNFPSLTAVGVHMNFAAYSGDGNFLGCTSPTITVTVVAPT
jgi:hypothetical protein